MPESLHHLLATSSVAPAMTLISLPYRYIAPSFSDVGLNIFTTGAFASIEKSVISLSTVFSDMSVKFIEINKSPAEVVDVIEKDVKYSGPLFGLLVF